MTSRTEHTPEWGPWIAHCGARCPVRPGEYFAVKGHDNYYEAVAPDDVGDWPAWYHDNLGKSSCVPGYIWDVVLEYRIRKPRGLTVLERVLKGVEVEIRKQEALQTQYTQFLDRQNKAT